MRRLACTWLFGALVGLGGGPVGCGGGTAREPAFRIQVYLTPAALAEYTVTSPQLSLLPGTDFARGRVVLALERSGPSVLTEPVTLEVRRAGELVSFATVIPFVCGLAVEGAGGAGEPLVEVHEALLRDDGQLQFESTPIGNLTYRCERTSADGKDGEVLSTIMKSPYLCADPERSMTSVELAVGGNAPLMATTCSALLLKVDAVTKGAMFILSFRDTAGVEIVWQGGVCFPTTLELLSKTVDVSQPSCRFEATNLQIHSGEGRDNTVFTDVAGALTVSADLTGLSATTRIVGDVDITFPAAAGSSLVHGHIDLPILVFGGN